MNRTMLAGVALAAMLGTMTVAGACPGGDKGMQGHMAQGGASDKGMHGASGEEGQGHQPKHLVRKIIDAVSKTGLSAKQAEAVTEAVNTFKMQKMEMMQNKVMPVDAFGDDAFDAAYFKKTMQKQFDAKIDAKIALFQSVYAVLTPEQRKIFKREFTAPMVRKMIKQNMVKGYMMPGKGMGKGCSHGK